MRCVVHVDVEASLRTSHLRLGPSSEGQVDNGTAGRDVAGHDQVGKLLGPGLLNFIAMTTNLKQPQLPDSFISFASFDRGMVDESGDQFVAYFMPTLETIEKRKRDAEIEIDYEEGEE